ncbi:hypothetical protein HYV82_00105 [Candidatus Woesearchaeota archaeon]|nr:hypothetical protein [Candidatus Woesearchaeota archaeon]
MPSAVLVRGNASTDKGGSPAQTLTHPELEAIVRAARISGAAEDSSITMIENPWPHSGYTGFLLARQFFPRAFQVELGGVLHVREKDFVIDGVPSPYNSVALDLMRTGAYETCVCAVADSELLLPSPSILPYALCFIPAETYTELSDALSKPGDRTGVLQEVYRMFAQAHSPAFSIGTGGRLDFPRGYANVRL